MKTISPPDLTAYALNELPPDAAAELSRLLTESPADAASAEETRAFCELLSSTLATPEAKEGGGLSAAQKQLITENLPRTTGVTSFRWTLWAGAGAAAAVAAWLAWPQGMVPRGNVAVESSKSSEPFLPGGGGGGRDAGLGSVASSPTRFKAAKEDLVSDPQAPASVMLADGAVDAKESAGKKLQQLELLKASPSALPNELPAPITAVPRSMEKDAEISADVAQGRQNLLATDNRAPSPGKPGEPIDAVKAEPMVAAKSKPAAAAPTNGPIAEAKPLLGGAVAKNEPLPKLKQNPAVTEGYLGKMPSLTVKDTLAVESEATRIQETRISGDRLYDVAEERSLRSGLAPGVQTSPGSESYIAPPENPFKLVAAEPLSTFSIDVDTASYANVRRFLNMGQRPPGEAVRVEELVNYFRYAYPAPVAGKPCSLTADLVVCPWNEHHRLARVALKARVDETRPKANLVFLLDVSGSMNEPNKLPLVKQSLKLLVDKLTENDRVSIVVYAGASGVVLAPTHGENKKAILGAIDNLQPGGSTNGASGIALAYEMARKEFLKEGVNRVILATDGDFNVGISDRDGLQSLIEKEAKSGVFLSVLGYGMGNLKDSTMETLADKGNGNYAYIDSLGEARKVLSEEMSSTLVTVAKDVKIQIEFNPGKVRAYKLLGYENRMLAKEDFNDDKKDAGEMGAGHTVTALYEITPTDAPADVPPVDPLKYQTVTKAEDKPVARPDSPEIMTVKLRYKAPDADVSQLMELPVMDKNAALASAPGDFQFATAVAGYGLLLRGSKQVGNLNWDMIRTMAKAGKGEDPEGYRGEFMQLLEKAAGAVPVP